MAKEAYGISKRMRHRGVDLSGESCVCCGEGCAEKLQQPYPGKLGGRTGIYCGSCFLAIERFGFCPDEEGYCTPGGFCSGVARGAG